MASYKSRVIDVTIVNRLRNKGAILVEGAKWCGKTTTCEQHASSILYMSDPDRVKQNLQLADISPRSLLQGETPRLIDEWQMAPKLWDAVRFEVDHRDGFGHFLLTGSAVPAEMEQVHHTGTGRFAWIKMRPMSLYESGESSGAVSLSELFSPDDKPIFAENKATLENIAFLICRGGWPQATFLEGDDALVQAFDYLDAVVKSDISRVDGVSRNETRALLLMRSLARHQGTQVPNTTICEDINVSDDMELCKLGERKQAIFCIIPDSNDASLNFLVGMLYTQAFQELYYQADKVHQGALPVPVRLMFDEFANVALPDGYARLQATMRSRNIMSTIILQNISQLKALFKDDWEGIIGNADSFVYLGGNEQSTHKYISELLGKETIDTRTSSQSKGRRTGFPFGCRCGSESRGTLCSI